MELSNNGLNLIKSFEGCKLYAYDDLTGKKVEACGALKGTLTIGYGHTGIDVKKGMTITQSQADTLLRKDLSNFCKAVNKYVDKYRLNQNQFDALVSFSFNCGTGALAKVMSSGNITGTMSQYVHSKGILLKGLQRRREAEVNLYNKPVPAACYKKCSSKHSSIVDALKEVGVSSAFSNRKKIAEKNGIKNYSGTASQNTKILALLKSGKLKKA